MAGPRSLRHLLLAALTLAVAGTVSDRAAADELLRLPPSPAKTSKPIQLAADEIATWQEAGEQVILLHGKVLIEQDVVSLRAQRAVVWASLQRDAKTSAFAVQVIADGSVQVENGPQRQTAPTVFAELVTKQVVKFRQGNRVVQQPQGADPFFRRALALRPAPSPQAAGGIQLTAGAAPATPAQNPGVPNLQAPEFPPAPGAPLPNVRVPGVAAPMPGPPATRPAGTPPAAAPGPPRSFTIAPRTSAPNQQRGLTLPSGERAVIVNGGIIITIRNAGQGIGLIDIEADRMVIWSKGGDVQGLLGQMKAPEGQTTSQELEFYFEGNVELRSSSSRGAQNTIKADRVYYDAHRNVAVAVGADLELRRPDIPQPLHMKADEIEQVTPTHFEAVRAEVFSSRLPSDPGLKVVLARATVEDKKIERRTIFGRPVLDSKGNPETYVERLVRGENVLLKFEDVPVFYLPVIQGDANDPLGPLQSLGFKQDRIFGTQVYTTFDVWNLLNRDPLPGTRWNLEADYLSRRGPALGSFFTYAGQDMFGLHAPYSGLMRSYTIYDTGTDILGGGRGEGDDHPSWRGRTLIRHTQTFFDDFTAQGQVSYLSDKNFLEQYYKQEFDYDVNQETFLYLKYQHDNYAATLLTRPHIRDWVTETAWLPYAEGYLLGQSFFNLFTYNLQASAGYAELHPTEKPPPPIEPTDVRDNTGRFDVMQELSLPFYLGPVKVVPYGVLDLTYYTDDLYGDPNGRLYGGGGVRGSLPFSRLYPNVQSELFNLNGIYHKVVLGGNYYVAHSSDAFTSFPQIDRLNDDATDQALRDIRPREVALNPAKGVFLATSPLFDPQLYAIRRLELDRIDTRDTIEVLQADVRQRWQTKRGFPGQEHVIDYLTLDLSASFFPHPERDNFGKSAAFFEYDTTWNVGDRTAVVSSGWFDPFDNGARVFTIGSFLNRPDRTSFYLGYRLIDPIDSRAVTAAATYIFSPKYAITASATYDFGINESLANSLVITRMGTDLTVSIGFTYNAILNNFGFTFEVLPNVVAMTRRSGSGLLGRTMGLLR